MQLHIYYGDFGLENAFPLPYLQFQGLLMREKQLECSEATSVSPDQTLTRPKFSVSLTLVYTKIFEHVAVVFLCGFFCQLYV